MNFARRTTATLLALAFCATLSQAGIITGWNTVNVTTDTGPHTEGQLYRSTLYTDSDKTLSNGFIGWEESDVQAPGMKVVNGDDQDGSNCIMTAGYNSEDGTDKQCSDPLKSSKRFKLKGELNAPMEITFDVAAGTSGPYKVLHKYSNYTALPWDEFTIELGFTLANGSFVKSTANDGIGFSDSQGNLFTVPVTSYQSKSDVLSGFFSQGLAGPADKHHPDTGYFDIKTRMSYSLIATEDEIVSAGISANYLNLFGPWNSIYDVPSAYFWDDDNDPATDDLLMANCKGEFVVTDEATATGTCAGQWVTYREYPGLVDGVPGAATGVEVIVSDAMINDWRTSDRYHTGPIEDLANLGLTYWVKVADTSNWPVPAFTIRFTPISADPAITEVCTDGIDNDGDSYVDCADSDCAADLNCGTPVAEICTDGIDNDGDSYADCADPDCSGLGNCGPEGRQITCRDGMDNDGDGAIDCDDSGCMNNKACRLTDDPQPTPSNKNTKGGQHRGNR